MCTATYSVQTQWSTGFVPVLAVANSGTTAITGWTVAFSYAGNQVIQQAGWNGTWSQSGFMVTVHNVSYNGNLAPGTTTGNIGAVFGFSGANSPPAVVACTAF
jgi:endoglucanase